MWFIGVVLIDIYLLVPKLCIFDDALEFYEAKQAKNGPNMRPEVVIYDFGYHMTSILPYACF